MKLSKGMKAAINQYYAFKYHNRTGFFSNGEAKRKCIDFIISEANKSKAKVEIAPGVIFLSRGKQNIKIIGPVL
jgi:hypothetical protein